MECEIVIMLSFSLFFCLKLYFKSDSDDKILKGQMMVLSHTP